MIVAVPNLEQIAQQPGGVLLVQALKAIQSAINELPLAVGPATSIWTGTGTPENKQVGNVGDLYLRTDGSTATTLYVKTSGTNTSTGWTAK